MSKSGFLFALLATVVVTLIVGRPAFAQAPACADLFKTTAAPEDLINAVIAIEDDLVRLEAQVARSRQTTETLQATAALREAFDVISMNALDDNFATRPSADEIATLREQILEQTRIAEIGVATQNPNSEKRAVAFTDILESPHLITAGLSYDVPQGCCTTGANHLQKIIVSFTDEIIAFMQERPEQAARFLRAIQKGFVAPRSGSGMVRMPDVHEKFVEVKVIGGQGGEFRFIGCRGANGILTLKKVYVKTGNGLGGSLATSHAKLCD